MHAQQERRYIRGESETGCATSTTSCHRRRDPHTGLVAAIWSPATSRRCRRALRTSTRRPLVIARAAPQDSHGYFGLGTNADYTATLIREASFFLEVDPAMPRIYGENQLHASRWSAGAGLSAAW
jgi:hypothetical protein